jgi:DNA-binding XRE family transcriptional regulator
MTSGRGIGSLRILISTKSGVLGRILPFLVSRFKETFPESNGDAYDFLIPPVTFGAWLQNLRLRRGLQLQELAKLLGVRPYTLIRYERNRTRPDQAVRLRLKKHFGLNGKPYRLNLGDTI